ncbi:DNA-binding protein SMUBP-2-like [Physella acuta]|uniref:DNA-binding protein SMUBP-2-like n=1 Tax=Physella acuta TaxID=109671 RepID=UPI0027DCD3EC|nr:DNA-binding protein SMUBP-2-like [Physella acuta]
MSIEQFVNKTLELIDKERDAEIEETQYLTEKLSAKELERRGVCLLKLQIKARRSGLYGRMVAVFEPQLKHGAVKNSKPELSSHNLSPGDIVGVGLMKSEATDKPLATGIVSQVTSSNISIAFDESQDIFELDDDALYKLTKLANDVTYRRLKTTLKDLAKYRGGPAQRLVDTFFCIEEVSAPSGEFPISFVNENLDESQRDAVKFALTQREVAIIHGPPGTGKTTTVVELIIQAVRQGLKVLATAPSNIAVDNLVERLANHKQKIVRIGHPARLLSHIQKYSLDAIVSGSEETGIVKDVKSDFQKALSKLKKARGHGEKNALREEMKHLRKEATKREEAATKEILSRADVVLVTLTSATRDGPLKYLKEDHFDLVVIDECSQALEVACWIGLMRARRCVLAGDHLQLPPTILSKEAASAGLEVTLMERLVKMLVKEKGKDVMRMLTTQYRMHEDIMAWASSQLYDGKLKAHNSVASHLLSDLDSVSASEETRSPLLLIDTAGCDLHELDLPDELSKGNEGEADIVAAHVEDLIKCGVKPVDIAVIAPYNMQVELIRTRLSGQYPSLEIKSVDGFQGREKEAVVISMVRSNLKGEVGFLAEKRRINVAVTRARRHLAVVCDTETVSHDPFIKSLVDYMLEKGEVLSAHQFIQEGKVTQTFTRPARLTDMMESTKSQQKPVKKREQPLQTKEEKMLLYQKELEKFVSDTGQSVLDFPATLNSHDRMVIHEVAEKLGLYHTSTGEGKDRHIQVSKTKPPSDSPGVAVPPCVVADAEVCNSSLPDTDSPLLKNNEEGENTGVENNLELPTSYTESKIQQVEKDADAVLNSQTSGEKVKTDAKENKNPVSQTKSVASPEPDKVEDEGVVSCKHCGKNIKIPNLVLHELHCSRQAKPSQAKTSLGSASGGVRKKETAQQEKKKEKSKKSQTQNVSEALSKIDDDDFDGLIASITELDSKCSFKKCKTLTNTLGRNCEYCTRRFCLTHLMPEIHGCGDAVREASRRLISREGVLHSGSGVPNKKPNAARRAQLEIKLEKKLGDLTSKRSKHSEKKKS